jgi:tetratricopeptide (TPR) repeat protein
MNRQAAQLAEKVDSLAQIEAALKDKDQEIQDVSHKARRLSETLRKDFESVQSTHAAAQGKAGRQAPVWAIFEQAIQRYKSEQWTEAAHLFQECVRQDTNWSAAYQYLALVYHALGQENEAAWAAEQALEKDPDNARLTAWANTLRATLHQKQPPAA